MLGTIVGILACVALMVIGYVAGYGDARRACKERLLELLDRNRNN